MKIVKLKGGLGNQMFQYAFAKVIESISDTEVKLDLSAFKNTHEDSIRVPRILKFQLSLSEASAEEVKSFCIFDHAGYNLSLKYRVKIGMENILNNKYYLEKNRAYLDPNTIKKYRYFDGYWQSWRYVVPIIAKLRKEFTPNYDVSEKTTDMVRQVSCVPSVFVGVRRGDYQAESSHYGNFTQDYYEHAFRIIEDKVTNPVYIVFSNDISWVKNNIKFYNREVVFREPEDIIDDFEEFLIMMACQHNIILNSTFHWWAAMLNRNENKTIIAPQKWFQDHKPIDIYPESWIRI